MVTATRATAAALHFRWLLVISLCAVLACLWPGAASSQTASERSAGAPRRGSGPIDYRGYVRVIDGDTVEITWRGSVVGVGLAGIAAPPGNTPCGRLATQFLQSLTAGGLYLAEDRTIEFDRRNRRMYKATSRDFRRLSVALVAAGLARPSGDGDERVELRAIETEARRNNRGCAFGVPGTGPLRPGPASDAPDTSVREMSSDKGPAAAASDGRAATMAGGFAQQLVAAGFVTPTAFTFLPDGRILVAEKSGLVKVIKNGAVLPTPFLDIRDRVNDYWDRGLIGIAADPNFVSNGYIYLGYTYENDSSDYSGTKTGRVSRYTASGDVASKASELTILGTSVGASCQLLPAGSDCIPSEAPSHSVGQLRFNANGNLFVSTGDGAHFNVVDDLALRAQTLSSLGGKVLLVSPTGAGLPTNPFWTGSSSANQSKVWAYGVRNAFRFGIRNGTYPYAGDVGWDTWEEQNAVVRGANLGWPCYEGQGQQPGYASKAQCQSLYAQGASAVRPGVLTWTHMYAGQPRGGAAVGGAFYTATQYPSRYRGALFYGDYAQNWIRYATVDASDNLTAGPFDFLFGTAGLTQIEQGSDGHLYYISSGMGELQRIVFSGADMQAPTIVDVTPNGTAVALSAQVTARASELLDPSTVAGNVSLARHSDGQAVTGSVFYDGNIQTITFIPDQSMQLGANTTYVATVRGGTNGVKDLAGNPLASDRTWSFTTVNPQLPPQGTSDLSSLTWSSMSNGWGPAETDRSNGEQAPGDGQPIRIRTQAFAKGLGVHAPSDIRYAIGNACSSLTATIGVDDEVSPEGSVIFQVFGDGVKLYESATLTGTTAPQNITVNISGRTVLQLVVTDGGNGAAFDHADWAVPRITCGTPPSTTISNVQAGSVTATSAVITWTTNNIADSQVEYGATSQYGSSSPLDSSLVTSHSVSLTGLTPNVAYHYRVRSRDAGGVLVVSPDATFTTPQSGSTTAYLSDMTWTSMTNGWGPAEKDKSNGEQGATDGRTISIRGVQFAKGLGTHSDSDIRYNVGGSCRSFIADVGIDDEVAPNGSVVFQVWGDGTKLYDSGTLRATSPLTHVDVDITGKAQLQLVVTSAGDGAAYDHASWGGARIACGGSGPVARITAPSSSLTYKVGDVIAYSGSATDSNGSAIPASSLQWQVKIHHCPEGSCHEHPFANTTGASGSFTVPDHGDDSYFEIVLTATGAGGSTGSASVTIQPQTVQLTLQTVPAGLQVVYGGVASTAPATFTTIVGSTHTVQVPSPQGSQTFSSWSDGGAQQHNITMGTTNRTLTATFTSTTGPLTVISTSPASGATGVPTSNPVTATFSRAIDPATLTWNTFSVHPPGSNAVPGVVTYNSGTGVFTPSSPLQSGITYTATITGGAAGVKDTNGVAMASDVVWSFTTAGSGGTAPVFLSDLNWSSAINGWGPAERDRSNGEQGAGDGRTLSIRGVTYQKGLGVHAASDIRYAIPQGCSQFTAAVGVDDEVAPLGSVIFQVWADGVRVYESGTLTASAGAQNVSVDITGRSELRLVVTDSGDGNGYDHADWGNAQMSCPAIRPPVGTSYLSDLNWTTMTNGWGPVEKDRSNGETGAADGNPLRIRGTTYAKGLGGHAASDVRYALGGACTSFAATIGVDDEVGGTLGSVIFQVWTDGVKTYESGLLTGSSAAQNITVDLTGKNQLQLVIADGGNGNAYDHADWANARITCP